MEDKSTYPAGPWHQEPDRLEWKDEATGLDCLILRGPVGSLCGYVGVPKGHKLHGVNYMEAPSFEVHGGLTYSNECDGSHICHKLDQGAEPVFWFGFDCAHGMDLMPGMMKYGPGLSRGTKYRDIEYVKKEVTNLAKQIAAY